MSERSGMSKHPIRDANTPPAYGKGRRILTIKGGSSSIKFALFEAGENPRQILSGGIEGVGLSEGTFSVKSSNNADNVSNRINAADHTMAVSLLMDWIQERLHRGELTAVGHRVVHGGPKYCEPQRVTPDLIAVYRAYSSSTQNIYQRKCQCRLY
jgi:acetate kinase